MKKLREQRQGDEDNVIPFTMPDLATSPQPPGKDWLRSLPFGCRFLSKKMGTRLQIDWYGIASIQEKAIMLGTDNPYHPGHLQFIWVDSMEFSKQNTFVQLLPDMKTMEEEGKPPD